VAAGADADLSALAGVLGRVTGEDVVGLDMAEAEVFIAATQRVINAMATRQAVAVAAYADAAAQAHRTEVARGPGRGPVRASRTG
jgi:ribosomal silencing factor RsfS